MDCEMIRMNYELIRMNYEMIWMTNPKYEKWTG